MLKALPAAVAAFVVIASPAATRADLDSAIKQPVASPYELIVIEADGCIYCDLFRRDVLPSYQKSEQGQQMPVRFVDINDVDAATLKLSLPINTVPTFVVVKNRAEVGRVPGYVGPENFYHTINYIMASAP